MGKEYIMTIDTGTTNTRVTLIDDKKNYIDSEGIDVGVRNTAIDGNNNRLISAVKQCLNELMKRNNIKIDNIKKIIGSGMITSNVGLYEILHVIAPCTAYDLAENAHEVLLEQVSQLPILFIPGIKNDIDKITLDNFEKMDMMRGEEVETFAILEKYPVGRPYLIILPGSHTKFVSVDEKGRIIGSLTSITGELLSSITKDTIIADAVDREFVHEYDKEMVLKGFDISKNTGLGRGCFLGRILNQFCIKDKQKIANYILGVTLAGDVSAIKNSEALALTKDTTVIVAGKEQLKQAIYDIFVWDNYFTDVQIFKSPEKLSLSAQGACIVYDIYSHLESNI